MIKPQVSLETDSKTASINSASTYVIYAVVCLCILVLMLIPASNLLHPSEWQRILGFWHGMGALIATAVIMYVGHFSFHLLKGQMQVVGLLKILLLGSSLFLLMAIGSGFWAYSRYQFVSKSVVLDGRDLLKDILVLDLHKFSVVSAFPLTIGIFYALDLYGGVLHESRQKVVVVGSAIALWVLMMWGLVGFATGIAFSKLQSL